MRDQMPSGDQMRMLAYAHAHGDHFPVDPPNLKEYFKLIEKGERRLPDMLANILVRRTRQHILRWYGYDAESHEPVDPSRFQEYLSGTRRAYVLVGGKHEFFPTRKLETIEYSIEDTYQGLYQELRGYLGRGGTGIPACVSRKKAQTGMSVKV